MNDWWWRCAAVAVSLSCNVTPNQPGAQMLHQINIKHVTPNKCYTKTRPGAQTPKYLALKMPLFHFQFGRLSSRDNFGTFFTVWLQCLLYLCVIKWECGSKSILWTRDIFVQTTNEVPESNRELYCQICPTNLKKSHFNRSTNRIKYKGRVL